MENVDVIALGELLIDFTYNGTSNQGNPTFEANPGGAPCNVLSMLAKLGKKTAFIGKVGSDQFGKLLRQTISEAGIINDYLFEDENVPTTLAFVHTTLEGDRSFSFYRTPGADMMLTADEISDDMVKHAKIFHFGTLSMTHESVRRATTKAVKLAKDNQLLISLDPNLREPLWDNLDNAKKQMLDAISYCDILKISDNELEFLTGEEDYDVGITKLRELYDIPLICLTLGKDGSRAYYKNLRVEVPGFRSDKVIDTTGAGDTFCGCVLNYICEKKRYETDFPDFTETELREMLLFANAAACLITMKKGAIKSMPERKCVEKLLTSGNDYVKS